ncbi:MAG: IS4 family transposase, partial [Nitrososphaera sp.]
NAAVQAFFSDEELDRLARETGFTKRPDGKISGSVFFDLIVFNSDKLKEQSLNDLSLEAEQRHGIEITKQSLHDRFNEYAPLFLKAALEKLLQKQVLKHVQLGKWSHFKRVLIKDSVCFEVDPSLAEAYPGSGGSASPAAMRIQFEYDLLSGRINDLSLHAFNDQDHKDSLATVELTREGDLIIRDLGYLNLAVLQQLIDQRAFFLGRLSPTLNVYALKSGGYEKVDFIKIHQYMKRLKLATLEKEVYLGSEKNIKVRLVIYLLPDQEVEKRLRKAAKNNKKKARKPLSKEYKTRAALNLFITNTTPEQIATESIWPFYRLRWQIELIFKVWKSICKIHAVKKVKQHRLECYVYVKLIFIVLGWQILWRIAKVLYHREGKLLSFYKSFKTLLGKELDDIKQAFLEGKSTMENFIATFYGISRSHHLLEKRKKQNTPMELLLSLRIN